MDMVRCQAQEVSPAELMTAAVFLTITIYLQRPKMHYGAKGLKKSAARFPTMRPDSLKIARAIEDALTGVVWRDDSQVVWHRIEKCWADGEDRPGVMIHVNEAPSGDHGE
jgi:Holliday junction resolvase RusA-like endonuclease